MNLIRFSEPLSIAFKKSAGGSAVTFEANRDYLIANAQLERIMRDQNVQARLYKVSRAEMRLPAFNIGLHQGGSRKRLLLWNGSGGYGDQILTWPVCKILSKYHDVHVLTDPGNNVCYWNLDFIKSVSVIPTLWESVKLFDYFLAWEVVVNMDEHQDQEHPVDVMLRHAGFEPASIPPEEKCVRPKFTSNELGSLQRFTKLDKKVGIFQIAAANPVRCLPPADAVFTALKLAEATPDMHWLCLYDEFVPGDYKTRLEAAVADKKAENIQAFCAPNLRELWALTEHVSCVVSFDSMMIHVAGVFGVPCIGLWGPMNPDCRVKYYQNHHAIHHREFCEHSPCFVYSSTFPRYCPPRPGTRTSCDVLAGISPQEIADLVVQVRR